MRKFPSSFSDIIDLLKEEGKHISTAFFVFGFIFDYFFLPKTDYVLTPYIGVIYVLGFALSLFARSTILTRTRGDVFNNKITSLISLLLAYFSGSILSYIFILYFRSALVAASIPFLLFALFAMFANEFVRTKQYRTYLDITVLFFSVTAVSVFVVPYIAGSVGALSFFSSLVVSLLLSLLFVYSLFRFSSKSVIEKRFAYALTLWSPLLFLSLYMSESLPPLPVSLSSVKMYHVVKKEGDVYKVMEEQKEKVSSVYHVVEGNPISFFSSIYAPVSLSAPISHAWEYYDESAHAWKEELRVDFTVLGGRKEGYRGYSTLTKTMPGKWRVSVYLDGKRLVGRHYFSLESSAPEKLIEATR